MKNELKNIIFTSFKLHNDLNGRFWRVFRSDTYVDLLMQKSIQLEKTALSYDICLEIILLASKAIINWELRPIGHKNSMEEVVQILKEEVQLINLTFERILASSMSRIQKMNNEHSTHSELNYFKVLNNLEISNYDKVVFENILDRFIYEFNFLDEK